MSKSRLLQVIALIPILLGSYMLYEHFINEEGNSSALAGFGAIIIGVGVLIVSKSKAITGK